MSTSKLPPSDTRTVPIQILVLGLCRTGTQSLADALEILGYKGIYHMSEVFKNRHGSKWIAALEAKYESKGPPFGVEQFDEFLGTYSVLSDLPAALFPDELIAAYPNAKIILTTRDEDRWFESMKATIWHLYEKRKEKGDTGIPFKLMDLEHRHVWGGDVDKFGRARFREHNEHLRATALTENFLEYEVKDGWGPLCEFLGKDVPKTPFPRRDDWLSYKLEHAGGQ